ncbi:MAG: trigger factor [Bacillota bacterium]|nr:trigger factor [Bacillota bacterium]
MNTKIEKLEANVVKLEITVEKEEFDKCIQKAYKKNVKSFNIPGFRKGKAPFGMIVRHYGVEVFYEDAMNFCYNDTYGKAIDENKLSSVDYPEIDIVQVGNDQDFIYTAKVTLKPEVELGAYKGIEVKKNVYPVTEEDVENEVKSMQQKNARVEVKENGAIESGDTAIIDFKGFINGEAFEGGEGKDFPLEIGSGSFIGDFEVQLIGLNKGDEKDVVVTFPENYGKDDLNGKEALFKVAVKEIKVKELPAIDDEFAKEVSEFDTIAELKEDIKAKKVKENEDKAKREYEDSAVNIVTDNAKLEIPKVMVEKEIDYMLKNFESRLKYQGVDMKAYYEYTNSSEEKVREMMKDSAERKVRTDLVLEKIAETEKVEASEEELSAKAKEIAMYYDTKDIDKTADLVLKSQKDMITIDIVNEKVIKLLVDSSVSI